jgi:hypothetical protein
MLGRFADIVLWPLKMSWPHWAEAIGRIGAFGLAVAVQGGTDATKTATVVKSRLHSLAGSASMIEA